MTINSICVCGAGTMGSGIAQAAAQAGYSTILYELNTAVLEKSKSGIEKSLRYLVDKNKISIDEKETISKRILFTNKITDCIADVFIEAIIEKLEVKIELFNQLAELNNSDSVFTSNTSSLSITSIAEKVNNPERVAGMHFFNPAQVMKLVEVVSTNYTNQQTINCIVHLANQMRKIPVLCKDSPGFIVNRVARPFYIEALRIAEEGKIDFEQIDTVLEATGFKMGPFKLMDLIGNDVNYAVSCSVYDQLGEPERLKPSHIQEEKVKNGDLGRKTKKGYYDYE